MTKSNFQWSCDRPFSSVCCFWFNAVDWESDRLALTLRISRSWAIALIPSLQYFVAIAPLAKGSIKPVQPIAGKAISTDCGSLRQKIPGTEFLFQMH